MAQHKALVLFKLNSHAKMAPDTRTSPGSVETEGAVGSRALAAPDDDTNASLRTESQSFLHGARNCSEWPAKPLCVAHT
jgi:hypothetical protein